jgi:hypothetical protein
MCVTCHTITDTPLLIRSIEQGSGPGWNLYACPDCAPQHLSQDEAMQLLFDHTAACAECALPSPAEPCAQGRVLVRVHSRTLRRKP